MEVSKPIIPRAIGLIVLLATTVTLQAQSYCYWDSPYAHETETEDVPVWKGRSDDWFTVRLYLHIVKRCDGTQEVTPNQIADQLNILQNVFNPHSICFSLYGIDYFTATDYFTCGTGCSSQSICIGNTNADSLMRINRHENANDVWLLPNNHTNPTTGEYVGISNSPIIGLQSFFNCAVIVGGKYKGESAIPSNMLSHEIGHVFGLYHTYRGYDATTYLITENPCKEYANGSNCLYCGDKVCDTPADPKAEEYTQVINGACTYDEPNTDANNDIYSPDMENIMASLPLPCSIHFTEGQGARMRYYLSTNFYLKKLLVNEVELINQQSIIVQLQQNWYADKSIKTSGIRPRSRPASVFCVRVPRPLHTPPMT